MRVVCAICCAVCLAACQRSSEEAQRFLSRGIGLKEAEQYTEALRLLHKAIESDPRCEDAYFEIALIYDDYLNDKSNAVQAYEQYLAVAPHGSQRERAERWLEAARQYAVIDALPDAVALPATNSAGDLRQELARRDTQLKLLTQQMSDRYHTELETQRQELLNAADRISALKTENDLLRRNEPNEQIARLLDVIATNETTIAELRIELEGRAKEAETTAHGQEMLQSLITNLQTEVQAQTKRAADAAALGQSNALLLADQDVARSKLQSAENQRSELQLQLAELRTRFVGVTAAAPAAVAFGKAQRPAPAAAEAAPALVAALRSATNEVDELKRKIAFHSQERDNFVATLDKLRALMTEKDQQIAKLKAEQEAVQIARSSTPAEDSEDLQKALASEREMRTRADKLLYERSVQLRAAQQRYDALQQEYTQEVGRRTSMSEYLARAQSGAGAPQKETARPVAAPRVASAAIAGYAGTPRPAAADEPRAPEAAGAATRVAPPRLYISSAGPEPGASSDALPRTHVVRRGDSLTKIATLYYGDSSKWKLIYERNRARLQQENQLHVGQTLVLP